VKKGSDLVRAATLSLIPLPTYPASIHFGWVFRFHRKWRQAMKATKVMESTVVSMEDLIQQANYRQHPFGKVWQPFDQAAFEEICENIARRGLDKEIIRYQSMILEGWHRYLACLAAKVEPRFIEFNGTDLEAAELVHASGIRRHSSAEQRYASFDMLCDACPAFKEKYEALKAKGEQQRKGGTPLGTNAQRVDVLKTKAEAAGVSKSTAKKVERVKRKNPGAVADIAAGKTTASKELSKKATKTQKPDAKEKKKDEKQESPPPDCTAKVSGGRSFYVAPEPSYDVASVIRLLQSGEATVRDDSVYLGDEEIAWLEIKDEELEYADFRAAQIKTNQITTTIREPPSEPPHHPVSLPFDPHFDPLPLKELPSVPGTNVLSSGTNGHID
jgi:hypothetical protein